MSSEIDVPGAAVGPNFGLQDLSELSTEDRSRQRYRRVAYSAAAAAAARSIAIATGFVALPLAVRYLGTEQYGLLATLTSFTALFVFADLGLSEGLVSGISAAHGRGEGRSAAGLVASAFYLLVAIAVAVAVAFFVIHPRVPWDRLFNVTSPEASAVADASVAVLVAMTLAGLPFGLAARVREGFQEGYVASLWLAVSSVVSLGALVVAIANEASLPWLVFAITLGPLLGALLNAAAVARGRTWLIPRPRLASWPAARGLLGLGSLFFVVHFAAVAAFQTDNVVIATILGAEEVTQYAVPMKLFSAVPIVVGFALWPLWPAYREALARGDHEWFERTVRRSVAISGVAGLVLAGLLVLVGKPLIRLWAGSDVTPDTTLLVALGIYALFITLGTAMTMSLYAVNAVRFVAATSVVLVVVNLGLSIRLTHDLGVAGPAWGSVVALALILAAQAIHVRSTLARYGDEHGAGVGADR